MWINYHEIEGAYKLPDPELSPRIFTMYLNGLAIPQVKLNEYISLTMRALISEIPNIFAYPIFPDYLLQHIKMQRGTPMTIGVLNLT